MTHELWTSEDELEFQIGDMNGIAFAEQKVVKGKKDKGHHNGKASEQRRLDEARLQVIETPQVIPPTRLPECQKKHITRNGK